MQVRRSSSLKLNSHSLYEAAYTYLQDGLCPIPIRGDGDPQQPKAAALPWHIYQYQQPSTSEIDHWLDGEILHGIALVCGSISQLSVLDIDQPEIPPSLLEHAAHLLQTRIVKSPRGCHIYWRTAFPVKTQPLSNADLKGQGSYIIAPPTHINGNAYTAINDLPILTISSSDLKLVLKLLKPKQPTPAETRLPQPHPSPDADTLRQHYQQLRSQGRNHALYTTARHAHKHGYTLHETSQILTPIHLHAPAPHSHPFETVRQRQTEAQQTIHSAYKTNHTYTHSTQAGLPNSVREALLKTQLSPHSSKHSCATARVLDALLLTGWRTGKTFTETQALQVCRSFGIGHDSLRKALSAQNGSGETLIHRIPVSGGASPELNPKPQRGRPQQRYCLPDNDHLCRVLGVELAPSDPLQPEDLASPQAYRMALECGLLQGRPGQYPRTWLANRLGVSRHTLCRYHRHLEAIVTPVYSAAPFTAEAAHAAGESARVWLQDAHGRRYPLTAAPPDIAVSLISQQPNHYRLPLPGERSQPKQALWQCPQCNGLQAGTARRLPQPCPRCPTLRHSGRVERERRATALMQRSDAAQVLARLRTLSGCPQVQRLPLTQANVSRHLAPEMVEWWPDWWHEAWLEVEGSRDKYPPIPGVARRLIQRHGPGKVFYYLTHSEGPP